jgi:large subunit ribosomal protein L25
MAAALKSLERNTGTKAEIKALRASGKVPAVVYGKKFAPVSIVLDAAELRVLFTAGDRNRLIDLDIPGFGVKPVFIKEITRSVIRREVTHVDFQVVETGDFVTYRVPVETVGVPVGVKIGGGNLQLVCRTLKVRVPAEKLVDKVEVEISSLEKGQAFFVKDVTFDGTILTPGRQAVCIVS